MKNIWMIVSQHEEAAAMLDLLELDASELSALVIGPRSLAEEVSGLVKAVKWIDNAASPADCYTEEAADILLNAAPSLLIGAAFPVSRAVLGLAAAKSGVPMASNILSVSDAGDGVVASRSAVEGKQIETLKLPYGSCILVSPYSFKPQAPRATAEPDRIEGIQAKANTVVQYLAKEPVTASSLKTAERIVSAGIGCSKEALFAQAKELASKLGAELGCSMPVATEYMLLPQDHYVGASGCKVAPKLYLALGISGSTPHRNGVVNAKTIVVINKDPNAAFFHHADYGIVGDLNEILPELIAALG